MSEFISCPVCNKNFDLQVVDSHVNNCLDKALNETSKIPNGKRQNDWKFLSSPPTKKRLLNDVAAKKAKVANGIEQFAKSTIGANKNIDKVTVIQETNFLKKTSVALKNNSSDKNAGFFPKNGFLIPLAEQVRPISLENIVGQDQVIGNESALKKLIETCRFTSLILWGPPGCGKTTLARVIAQQCTINNNQWRFMQLSATSSGTAEVKQCIEVARNNKKMFKKRTVLFIDEIHRFNKTQQDTLLACIEDGTIIFIGATTENPSFQVNNALLSRCKVVVMEKLANDSLKQILINAMKKYNCHIKSEGKVEIANTSNTNQCGKNFKNLPEKPSNVMPKENNSEGDVNASSTQETFQDKSIYLENEEGANEFDKKWFMENGALELIVDFCDGDARKALNCLQSAFELKLADGFYDAHNEDVLINCEDVENVLMRSVQYDKKGEEHYNAASALQKSIRGSSDNGAIYWLARMLEGGEDPLFIARRLVVCASEDIGLADNTALPLAVSTFQACHFIGMPECAINLAHCATYLARCNKSNESYSALNRARSCIQNHKGALPGVPLHLRNAPTKLMRDLGYHKGYKYNHDFDRPVDQVYLPDALLSTDFFERRT